MPVMYDTWMIMVWQFRLEDEEVWGTATHFKALPPDAVASGEKKFFFPKSGSPSSGGVRKKTLYLAISRDRARSIPRVFEVI